MKKIVSVTSRLSFGSEPISASCSLSINSNTTNAEGERWPPETLRVPHRYHHVTTTTRVSDAIKHNLLMMVTEIKTLSDAISLAVYEMRPYTFAPDATVHVLHQPVNVTRYVQ